eukprot:15433652-Alexandrium_andersonii.AAC.1
MELSKDTGAGVAEAAAVAAHDAAATVEVLGSTKSPKPPKIDAAALEERKEPPEPPVTIAAAPEQPAVPSAPLQWSR